MRNEKEPGHFFRFFESAKSHGIFRSLEEYSKIAVNTTHVEMVRHILKLCEVACPPTQVEELPKDIEVVTNTKEEVSCEHTKSLVLCDCRYLTAMRSYRRRSRKKQS